MLEHVCGWKSLNRKAEQSVSRQIMNEIIMEREIDESTGIEFIRRGYPGKNDR